MQLRYQKKNLKNYQICFCEEDYGPFVTAIYHHHDREDIYEGPAIQEYAKKYYLEQISEYLGKDIKSCIAKNQNKLLYRNNSYTPKAVIASDIWEKYLLIKGLLNKFDYTVSAGYEVSEIVPDLQEKKLKKSIEMHLREKRIKTCTKSL